MWAMLMRTAPLRTSTPTWATSTLLRRAPSAEALKPRTAYHSHENAFQLTHCVHLPLASTHLMQISGPCRYYDRYIESMNTDGPV